MVEEDLPPEIKELDELIARLVKARNTIYVHYKEMPYKPTKLTDAILRVMSDGKCWSPFSIHEELAAEFPTSTEKTINSTMYRMQNKGYLERPRTNIYRLKPDVRKSIQPEE